MVLDFGTPAGAKYTLFGFQNELRDATMGGARVIVSDGVTGKVILPVEHAGPHVLAMRARATDDGRATIYLDGETLHQVTLPTDGSFAVVTLDVPATTVGEHFLQVRVPRGGFAIDWVRLGPAGTTLSSEAPVEDGEEGLALTPETTLGYAMEVPDGASLVGRTSGAGSLRVRVVREGGPDTAPLVSAAGAFTIDLAPYAGEVVRLDVGAEGAPIAIDEARVVTFDGAAPRDLPRYRNAIVVLVDTLRADKLRVYSPTTRVRTPGLDRFATGAALFARGHSAENWTKPSVATLLSGVMPWEHHATTDDAVVPASVELLPERLRTAGFATAAFVANGFVSDRFGFDQGFRSFRNYIREGRRSQASFVAADVLAWLDARDEAAPFFLYVHTIDPHVPYLPPDAVLATYDPDPYTGIVDFNRDRELLEKIKIGRITLAERDRARLQALYDAEITYHDQHFDAVVEGLSRRGLDRDTLVLFTADHGEEFFDHGSVGHGHSVFEELLHVPFLLRAPGLTEDVRIDEPVGLVDAVPTILELLGQPIPDGLAGRSLVPLLRGDPRATDAPRSVVSCFMDGWRTIVAGRYKLVQRTASRTLLYDLQSDPGEATDIAAAHPRVVRYLRGLLGLTLAGHAHGPSRVTRAPATRETTTIDAETEAQLRALGYVGTSRPH